MARALGEKFPFAGLFEPSMRLGTGSGLNAVRLSSFALSLSKGEWASIVRQAHDSARTANRTVLGQVLVASRVPTFVVNRRHRRQIRTVGVRASPATYAFKTALPCTAHCLPGPRPVASLPGGLGPGLPGRGTHAWSAA